MYAHPKLLEQNSSFSILHLSLLKEISCNGPINELLPTWQADMALMLCQRKNPRHWTRILPRLWMVGHIEPFCGPVFFINKATTGHPVSTYLYMHISLFDRPILHLFTIPCNKVLPTDIMYDSAMTFSS
jgi:hypothetical protein